MDNDGRKKKSNIPSGLLHGSTKLTITTTINHDWIPFGDYEPFVLYTDNWMKSDFKRKIIKIQQRQNRKKITKKLTLVLRVGWQ